MNNVENITWRLAGWWHKVADLFSSRRQAVSFCPLPSPPLPPPLPFPSAMTSQCNAFRVGMELTWRIVKPLWYSSNSGEICGMSLCYIIDCQTPLNTAMQWNTGTQTEMNEVFTTLKGAAFRWPTLNNSTHDFTFRSCHLGCSEWGWMMSREWMREPCWLVLISFIRLIPMDYLAGTSRGECAVFWEVEWLGHFLWSAEPRTAMWTEGTGGGPPRIPRRGLRWGGEGLGGCHMLMTDVTWFIVQRVEQFKWWKMISPFVRSENAFLLLYKKLSASSSGRECCSKQSTKVPT